MAEVPGFLGQQLKAVGVEVGTGNPQFIDRFPRRAERLEVANDCGVQCIAILIIDELRLHRRAPQVLKCSSVDARRPV